MKTRIVLLVLLLASTAYAVQIGGSGVDNGDRFPGSINTYDSSGGGLYWETFHLGATKVDPGGSGATATVSGASFYYLMDANTEYLYMGSDVHGCWDAASDIVVEVVVALNALEDADDLIQAEVVAEYYGEHEDMDTPGTQTRTIDHDIVSDNAAGDVHHLIFILDYDLGGQVISVGDTLKLSFRLDTIGAGDVAAVRFLRAAVYHRRSKPSREISSFPTEG